MTNESLIAITGSTLTGGSPSTPTTGYVVNGGGWDTTQYDQPNATSGTYALTYNGASVLNIPVGATPSAIQADFEALVGQGNVNVTQNTGSAAANATAYVVLFQGALAGTNVQDVASSLGVTLNEVLQPGGSSAQNAVVNLAGATGGSFTLTYNEGNGITQTTTPIAYNATPQTVAAALDALNLTNIGSTLNSTIQTVTLTTSATSTLTFDGATTGAIAVGATAATVQTAIQNLTALGGFGVVGPGNVLVSGPTVVSNNNVYSVTFTGSLGAQQQPLIVANTAGDLVSYAPAGGVSNIIVTSPNFATEGAGGTSAGPYYIEFAGALAGGAEGTFTIDPTNGGSGGLTFPLNPLTGGPLVTGANTSVTTTETGGVVEPQITRTTTGVVQLESGPNSSAHSSPAPTAWSSTPTSSRSASREPSAQTRSRSAGISPSARPTRSVSLAK